MPTNSHKTKTPCNRARRLSSVWLLLVGVLANSVSAEVREPGRFVPPLDCQAITPRFIFLPSPIGDANTASYGPASYSTTLVAGQLFAPPQLPQPLPAVIDDRSQATVVVRRRHGPIVLLPDPTDGPYAAQPFPATQLRPPIQRPFLNQPQLPAMKPHDRLATRRVTQPSHAAPSAGRRVVLERKISQVRSLLNLPQRHWAQTEPRP